MPGINDAPHQVAAVIRAGVEAGAQTVHPIVLHLRPGAKEWFMANLQRIEPRLVAHYAEMYRRPHAPKAVVEEIQAMVRPIHERFAPDRTGSEYWEPSQLRGGQLALAL
jgi:DNA repair photolyase